MDNTRPKVGVGLLIVKGNKILLGKRLGSHGANEYGGTGGHLELLESIEDCALRELAEEAGEDIKVKNLRFLCLANLLKYKPKHYIDIGMVAEWVSGAPIVVEPDKREAWEWYDIDNLPTPLFAVESLYIEAYKSGQSHFGDVQ